MCGIAGIISLSRGRQINFEAGLAAMNELLAHRGPDGSGTWIQHDRHAGFTHRRLSVIDLTDAAAQPMIGANNTVIVHNGEIYNYLELRAALRETWTFRTESDTETILAAYATYGAQFASHLRGMFAFAIWDEHKQRLICVRDRIGIKPLYYAVVDEVFYFAAEAKGLLPFLPDIETDPHALTEYLTFQYTIGEQTLFKYIKQLMPGHQLVVENGRLHVSRYWDVVYDIESGRPAESWESELEDLMSDSIDLHLRSDVQVGTYISGGVDSTLTSILARRADDRNRLGFHGRFLEYPGYDESHYAGISANAAGIDLSILDITAADFEEKIRDVIYYLDYPVAGPGSFPQ
jgi:asparagine synthase (glutamine-hydrolysing)